MILAVATKSHCAEHGRHEFLIIFGLPLLILLIICLVLSEIQMRASRLSAVIIGFLLLCRPDSLLILISCFGFWILSPQTRRSVFRNALIVGLISLTWVSYAIPTFGSVIPSSLIAKLVVPNQSGIMNLDSFQAEYFPFITFLPFILAICVVGTVKTWRDHEALRPFLFWIPLYYTCFSLGGAPDFAWYYVPPLVFVPLLLNQGIFVLTRHLSPSLRLLSLCACIVIASLFWLKSNLVTTASLRSSPYEEPVHKKLALLVKQKAGPADFTAAMEVGMLSYFSGRPVLDLLGLTYPEVLKWSRLRDFEGIIRQYRPRFLMAVGMNGSDLGYREIARIPYWAGKDYLLWERIQK